MTLQTAKCLLTRADVGRAKLRLPWLPTFLYRNGPTL